MDTVLNRSAEPEPGEDREESILKGMHILVVEDNEINAEILRELLDMAGASCDVCENGQTVLEKISLDGIFCGFIFPCCTPVRQGSFSSALSVILCGYCRAGL